MLAAGARLRVRPAYAIACRLDTDRWRRRCARAAGGELSNAAAARSAAAATRVRHRETRLRQSSLQPQDRKSLTSGDSKSAVEARAGCWRRARDASLRGTVARRHARGHARRLAGPGGSGPDGRRRRAGELAGGRAIAAAGSISVAAAEPVPPLPVDHVGSPTPTAPAPAEPDRAIRPRAPQPPLNARVPSPGGASLAAVPAKIYLIEREALHGTVVVATAAKRWCRASGGICAGRSIDSARTAAARTTRCSMSFVPPIEARVEVRRPG